MMASTGTLDGSRTIVSAPGKVLIAGGYLVLDQKYSGFVVGTSSRFYTSVVKRGDGFAPNDVNIKVRSPQFLDGEWNYDVHFAGGDDEGRRVDVVGTGQGRNGYVECTLQHTFTYLAASVTRFKELLGNGIEILILGHNDFYSQREQLSRSNLPLTTTSLASLPPFCSTHTTIPKVHKTGLGSSAAMITSLVGSLLSHFNAVKLPSAIPASVEQQQQQQEKDLEQRGVTIVHNLAQLTHCLAQGKIGSGFDVSAAAFGSQSYKRFSPDVLEGYMNGLSVEVSKFDRGKSIVELIEPGSGGYAWDNDVKPFRLPPGLGLMLADIDAGSSTPKLVSGILGWRKSKPEEAEPLWETLHGFNQEVEHILRDLCDVHHAKPDEYRTALEYCASSPAFKWAAGENEIVDKFSKVYSSFMNVRSYLRKMSELSSVPVEPPPQTRLLDACYQVPGVLMAGVPGAGGFDAIFVVVIGPQNNRDAVEEVWSRFDEMNVGPLLAGESREGGLVKEVSVVGLERFV
ncbi:phosphomevalonate kinase [Blyttiomyces sp. JEL0837]|nr:phosphomevalonate kinase [Blyttiomyces sp. JEL0837]